MQNNGIPPSMDEMFRQPQVTSPGLEMLQLQRGGIPNPEQAVIVTQTVNEHLHTENAQLGLRARLQGNFGEWVHKRKEIYHHNLAVINEAEPSHPVFFNEIKHTEQARVTLYEQIKHSGVKAGAHIRAASNALRGNRLEYSIRTTETRTAKEIMGQSLRVALGAGILACRGVELIGNAKVYGMTQAVSDLMDTLGKTANRKVNGIEWGESFQFGVEYTGAFIETQLHKFGITPSDKISAALQDVLGLAKVFAEDPENSLLNPKNLRKAMHHL